LYHLLAGAGPFAFEDRSPEQIARIVCEQEPLKPSAAAQKTTGAGETRNLSSAELVHELSGDLDSIVLKALRKEPGARYESARMLSGDLDRFLNGLPVQARREELLYRGGKFLKRKRQVIAAAVASSVIGMVLAAGIGRVNRPAPRGLQSIAV